jgi:selenide,water dikinase
MIKINKSLKLQELNKDNYLLSLTHYEPQKEFLALLTIGNGEAISSWKGLAFSGTLIWKLKDTIDKGFMNKFNVSHLGIPPKTKD